MKITCAKCGKRFNAEDNMYICPKCNHYHSQVGARSKMTEEAAPAVTEMMDDFFDRDEVQDEEPDFIQTLNGEQKVYTARSPQKQKAESTFDPPAILKKIGLAICIIVGFIMAISSAVADFDDWSEDGSSWGSGWDSYTNEVPYGEPMDFEGFSVNVCNAGAPYLEGLKCPDGYKLVQIDYTAECYVEEDSVMADVSLIYDDSWYDALYEDDLSDDPEIQDKLTESGFSYEAHTEGEHYWIFRVPDDAVEVTLEITSFVAYDEDDWGSSYDYDEQITMPLVLE